MAKPTASWMVRLVTEIENRLLDRTRSPLAASVAELPPTGRIDDFRGRKYCVLVSYRKNGDAIPSPLWFGIGDGKLYVHTGGMKVKRIERNPTVRVAPSTFRGRPIGSSLIGTARVVSSPADANAEAYIQANYGVTRRLYYKLSGQSDAGVYIEVTPQDAP
ncbi:MAG: PPOX class F420-dependent oxidoreductase [Acidimicrobiales bacterium]